MTNSNAEDLPEAGHKIGLVNNHGMAQIVEDLSEAEQEIKDELDSLNENDVLFIEDEGNVKYAIMPIELYDSMEDLMSVLNGQNGTSVRIATPDDLDLSYDEYERIKKQIMDAVEKTFMPKPEKLN